MDAPTPPACAQPASKRPTALHLFRQFHSRFREISMGPVGFEQGELDDRFYLIPMRDGKRIDRNVPKIDHLYFDFRKARRSFRTDFSPKRGTALVTQQKEAAWKKLEREFAKRRFSLDADTGPSWRTAPMREKEHFFAHVRAWRKMRGLVLDPAYTCPRVTLHWSAFVPEDTPEHSAVHAALVLEALEKDCVAPSSRRPAPTGYTLEAARAKFEQSLRALERA